MVDAWWINAWFNGIQTFDLTIKNSIKPDPALVKIFQVLTQAGSGAFLILVALSLLLLATRKGQLRPAIVLAGGLLTVYLTVEVIKQLWHRARPLGQVWTWAPGFSFPSGHAACSMFVYGFLIYWILRQDWTKTCKYLAAIALGFLIGLIGFSRIYLNVHYTSDVLSGFLLGLVWILLSVRLLRTWSTKWT